MATAKKDENVKATENNVAEEQNKDKEIASAEEQAKKILEEAERKAAESTEKMISEAEERIKSLFSGAQLAAQSAMQQPTNITIQQPKEEKAQLPDYIKQMQQDMMKDTTLNLFEDGDKYVDDKFISVNGIHRYQIKRGVAVKVPGYIKDINDFSEAQDTRTNKLMKAKQEEKDKEISH